MKELSIEEKARAYDRALAKAKEQAIDGYLDAVAVNDIFLELKESEDERILENCIHFLELQKSHHASIVEIEECIAWIEKQGAPVPDWKPSDEQMRVLDIAIRCGINRGTTEETTLVSLFNDLKKLKEGKL